MQEVSPPPVTPSNKPNVFLYLGMVLSALGGAIICLGVSTLCWEAIRRSKVSFVLPTERTFYKETVEFDGPGKPWLSLASVLLLAAFLTYIPRIYQIIRRKKQAIDSAKLTSQLMAIGGLCFFAGAEIYYGGFLLGALLMAYAGVGYLAYTHWERLRAQLYKD